MFYSVGTVFPVVMLNFEPGYKNYQLCWNNLNSLLLSFGDLQFYSLRGALHHHLGLTLGCKSCDTDSLDPLLTL